MTRSVTRKLFRRLLVLCVLCAGLFFLAREQPVYADTCDLEFTLCRGNCAAGDTGCITQCEYSYADCANTAYNENSGNYQPIGGGVQSCRAADTAYRYCLKGGYASREDFQACIDSGSDRDSCCVDIVYAEHPECY